MGKLDFDALSAKLSELTNKSKVSDVLFKPQKGTNIVRAVPLASNPSVPFIEAKFHYNIGGKTYLSPLTFGEDDPIEEFGLKLRSGGNLSREEWNETKKFIAKPRTFLPVVVRGKESEGVRFWGFGKTTYVELLSIMNDEDYGDITDPAMGRDIKIEFTPGEESDTNYPQTKIRISPKQTPITTDKELLNNILTVQPNIFDYYEKLSYDELADVLEKFLSPQTTAKPASSSDDDWDSETTETSSEEETVSATTSKSKKKAASSEVKKGDIDEEFDKMFNS